MPQSNRKCYHFNIRDWFLVRNVGQAKKRSSLARDEGNGNDFCCDHLTIWLRWVGRINQERITNYHRAVPILLLRPVESSNHNTISTSTTKTTKTLPQKLCRSSAGNIEWSCNCNTRMPFRLPATCKSPRPTQKIIIAPKCRSKGNQSTSTATTEWASSYQSKFHSQITTPADPIPIAHAIIT